MKELDKAKAYYLVDLNEDELKDIALKTDYITQFQSFKKDSKKYLLYFDDVWIFNYVGNKTAFKQTNAKELFTPNYEVTMIAEAPNENSQSITDEALLNHITDVEKKVTTAYKETSNKLNYELDFNFITQMAERMAQNKHKYEPYNWQKLDNIEDLKQALLRHVLDVLKGNYKDSDRMFGHLEAIALNAMFINYQLNKNGKI